MFGSKIKARPLHWHLLFGDQPRHFPGGAWTKDLLAGELSPTHEYLSRKQLEYDGLLKRPCQDGAALDRCYLISPPSTRQCACCRRPSPIGVCGRQLATPV